MIVLSIEDSDSTVMESVSSRNILSRYSVRSFSDRDVQEEDVLAIIEAARAAPSS